MNDFDFDELDKAVNSLNKTDDSQEQDKKSDLTQAVVNNDRPLPSLAARRTPGPFMDVIHPSSNMMKNVSQTTPKNAPVSKPSLIDQNSSLPETKPEIPSNNDDDDDDINKISEDINKTLGLTNDSPFITDAQVEKRPLGAFSGESDEESLGVAIEKQDEILPVVDETPLPAELNNDLLSIEANSVAKSTMPEEPINSEVNQVETVENEQKPLESLDESTTSTVPVPNQYVEKTNPKSESSPIYENNETYKQTLMPAKKKAGWLWVIWILLLILIGAGVGAAVYFFVLEP